jgi:hypothetical protein
MAQETLVKEIVVGVSCGKKEKKIVEEWERERERERGAYSGYSITSEELGWWRRLGRSCS